MQPRPLDLVALARLLPTGAIVLSFDVETCAAPGGDARVAGRARVLQLGIAAFSGEPLPGCGDAVCVPATTLRYVHRTDAAGVDGDDPLASYVDESADVPAGDEGGNDSAPDEPIGYVFADVVTLNPGCRIDAASQAVHKITDAQTRNGPELAQVADELKTWLLGIDPTGDPGADATAAAEGMSPRKVYVCGYNALRYDVPVLAADLRRIGRTDVAELLEATPLLDCMLIRKAAEQPFTLQGSLRRYGFGDLEDAHTADADSLGTLAVLAAQAAFGHLDLGTALELGTPKAAPAGAVDSQGKLRWVDGKTQDKPTPDNITVEFGKHKGKTLRVAGPNYCKWILGGDFPDEVKNPIRAAWGPAAARW